MRPGAGALEGGGDAEQGGVGAGRGDELEGERQAGAVEAGG